MKNLHTLSHSWLHKAFALLAAAALVLTLVPMQAFAQNPNAGGSGAIWTNTGPCGSPQNVNLYSVG